MLQFASGGLQGHVNKDRISNLQVPLLDITFQQKIEYLILQAHDKLNQSKSLYSEAEILLLQELDLENYEPDRAKTSPKFHSRFPLQIICLYSLSW